MKHYGNISKIHLTEKDCVDVVVGGSPCQNFSVAGDREGLAGEKSSLFLEYIRIIKEMREVSKSSGRTDESVQCRYAVFENVPGLLSSNRGEDFRRVLEEFCRIKDPSVSIPRPSDGWLDSGTILGDDWSLAWRVMDAQFWGKTIISPSGEIVRRGTPQRRRRLSLVADFAGRSAGQICFESSRLCGY